MARLSIPDSDLHGLTRLFTLTTEERRELVAALSEVDPAISVGALAADVAARTGIVDVGELLRVLRNMYLARRQHEIPVEDFVEAVMTAAARRGKPELNVTDDARKLLMDDLSAVLSLDQGFGVSARALEVLAEQERIYCSARVLTDARPVFRDDVTTTPAGAVIMHTLRIDYHPDGHDQEERFMVGLDADDLRSLRRLIDRALSKEAALAATLEAAGVKRIGTHTDREADDDAG